LRAMERDAGSGARERDTRRNGVAH
jgi:hypothetical protein